MKRFIVSTFVVLAFGFVVGSYSGHVNLSDTLRSQQNYTITYDRRVLNTRTGNVKEEHFVKAKRKNVLFARENYHSNNGIAEAMPYSIELFSVAENKYEWLDHRIACISTQYYPPVKLAALSHIADPTCETRKLYIMIGKTTFLGVPVVVHRMERQDRDHIVRIRWDAPDCDCESLYTRTYLIEPDGSISVVDVTTATHLSFSPPKPDLFVRPKDYREVPPSVIKGYSWSRSGIVGSAEALEGWDNRYYRSQMYKNPER